MKKRATWLRFAALAFAAVLPAAALAGCTEAEVNITATGLDAVYNGEAQLPQIEVTGSDEKNVTILAGETEVSEAVDAGEYSIVVTAGDAEETFTFTIAPKPVEIGSLSGFEKVYDGTANYTAEIVSPDGTIIGDELTATVSGTFDSPAVGTDKALDAEVTLSGADSANYQASVADGLKASVVAKELTIGGLTFEPVKYGVLEAAGIDKYEVQYTGTPELSGVLEGDEVSVTIEQIRFSELKVGKVDLAVQATLLGADADNYKLSASGGLSAMVMEDESVFSVNEHGELVGYTGNPDNLVIPETIGGVTVKSIADELFRVTDYTEDGFETVELPDTLERIGDQAFAGNILLESIVIPASVTEIGEGAFSTCSALSSIQFAGGGSAPLTVGVSAFESTSATDVTIPDRMTEIPRYCFADCDGGSGYVKIHKDVTVIGQEAFLNRSNQGGFTSIEFEEGGTEALRLEQQALAGARFGAVEVPARCNFIGFACMQNCKYLTSLTFETRTEPMQWGANTAAGGPFTFAGCDQLTSVVIPGSLGTFKGSFQDCLKLTSVTFEEGITEIGDYAFWSAGITSVTIPASCTRIGYAAFQNCSALTSLTFAEGADAQNVTIADWAFAFAPITRLHFPARVVSIGFAAFKNHNATQITFELERDTMLTFEHHPFDVGFPDESSAFNQDNPQAIDPVVLPKNINLTLEEIGTLMVFPAGTQVTISET